ILIPLNFGTTLVESIATSTLADPVEINPGKEVRILRTLLLLNGGMFVIEIALGFYAQSMGLISDGLDMLADALVYGMSLYAVGKAISQKRSQLESEITQGEVGLLKLKRYYDSIC